MSCQWPSGTGGPGEYRQTLLCRLLCGAARGHHEEPGSNKKAMHECMALSGYRVVRRINA